MGKFVEKVRSSQISHPVHRSFSLGKWKSEFDSCATQSPEDEDMYLCGIFIYNILSKIRSILSSNTYKVKYEEVDLIEMFAAYINRNYYTFSNQCIKALEKTADGGTIWLEKAANIKLLDIFGKEYPAEEMLITLVDSTVLSINRLMNESNFKRIKANDTLILNRMITELGLAQVYLTVEGYWDSIAWGRLALRENPSNIKIYEIENEINLSRVISEFRRDLYISTSSLIIADLLQKKDYLLSALDCITRDKNGELSIIKYSELTDLSIKSRIQHAETSKAILESLYFDKILELPANDSLSLGSLLNSYSFLSNIGAVLYNELPKEDSVFSIEKLSKYSTKISRKELVILLSSYLKISIKDANWIISFFTFKGKSNQELWSNPLVQSDSDVIFILPCVLVPNVIRSTELWMKQLNIDLGIRGKEFEQFVFKRLHEALNKNSIIKSGTVKSNIKFNREQIDLVVKINSVFYVCELKCNLTPIETREYYYHFEDLEDASKQITRKVNVINQNIQKFCIDVFQEKEVDLKATKVIPLIITNLEAGAGLLFNGVVATDYRLVENFLSTSTTQIVNSINQDVAGVKLQLYTDESSAARNLLMYLKNPPLVFAAKKSLIRRETKLAALSNLNSKEISLDRIEVSFADVNSITSDYLKYYYEIN